MAKAKKTKKQKIFIWQGVNKSGAKIKGEQSGENLNAIKVDLRSRGIVPLKVKRKPKPLFSKKKPKIKPGDIAIFSRMLATMMQAGLPLMQALQIIGEGHDNLSMKDLILAIKSEIEGGSNFAEALAKFPLYFDDLFISLIAAGEHSGQLETLLEEIATYKEKSEALKTKIKKALTYPIAILVVAFIVTVILMIFVIPQFETLFSGFGAELPALTQFVIKLSLWFQSYWYWVVFAVAMTIFVIKESNRRSHKVHAFFDRFLLKIPIIGSVLENGAIARFTRTFSTLFKAGVPMVEAMDSVAGATGNIVFSDATLIMKDEVATGTQLNIAMRETNLFPSMTIQLVAIGEESGSLDAMLAKVAEIFESEVETAVDNMTAMMEPLIMSFLGVVIGTLVIAMYLPIFKLGAVVS